jgi:hypothetical protein
MNHVTYLNLNFNYMYRSLFLTISKFELQLHVSDIVFANFWNWTSTTCIEHCFCLFWIWTSTTCIGHCFWLFLKLNFNYMYRTLFLPISEIELQLHASDIVFAHFWNWTSTTCIGHCLCLFLKLNFNYMYRTLF